MLVAFAGAASGVMATLSPRAIVVFGYVPRVGGALIAVAVGVGESMIVGVTAGDAVAVGVGVLVEVTGGVIVPVTVAVDVDVGVPLKWHSVTVTLSTRQPSPE